MEIYHPRDDELLREMRRVRRENGRRRLLWWVLAILVFCALFGWMMLNRLYVPAIMKGPAMGDTLPEGSLVLVRRCGGQDCRAGDIILFETEDGYQMKRAIAKGGDRIVLNPYGETRINGSDADWNYLTGRHEDAGVTARRLTVPEGELFVQGDLLSLSADSRDREYGTVPEDKVIGKIDIVLWPVSRIGRPVLPEPTEEAETQQGVGE